MRKRWILIPALLLASGASLGAEAVAEQGQRCARIADSLERLVCYDRLFAPATPGNAARTDVPRPDPLLPPPAVPPAAATGEAPASAAAPAPARAAAPAPDRATAPAPAGEAAADFGADQLRRSSTRDDEESGPRTLTATIQSLRETRPNVFRMELDNGQVWQQMDMDSLFHVKAGDTVEINRGRLGGYRMSRTSRGGSGWVRVNRLK